MCHSGPVPITGSRNLFLLLIAGGAGYLIEMSSNASQATSASVNFFKVYRRAGGDSSGKERHLVYLFFNP